MFVVGTSHLHDWRTGRGACRGNPQVLSDIPCGTMMLSEIAAALERITPSFAPDVPVPQDGNGTLEGDRVREAKSELERWCGSTVSASGKDDSDKTHCLYRG
jgi:hypothetical protein